MLAQIGTQHAAEEVKTLCRVLKGRDALAELADALPLRINNLANGQLDDCKALVESTAAKDPDLFTCALLMVMSRLSAPWQLVRLAIRAAASDAAARIAETPYAVAVTIVLMDVERQVEELRTDLRDGRGVAIGALLKSIHDSVGACAPSSIRPRTAPGRAPSPASARRSPTRCDSRSTTFPAACGACCACARRTTSGPIRPSTPTRWPIPRRC